LECSFLDLWNPYMLSCRMNELILLCLKYLGSTTCWNLLLSLIINSVPEGDQ
jgi:hypothetical protein